MRRSAFGVVPARCFRFQAKQAALGFQTAGKARQISVAPHDAVAGHKDSQRVGPHSSPHSLGATAHAHAPGNVAIRQRGTVGYAQKFLPHPQLKVRSQQTQRNVGLTPLATEKSIQLPHGLLDHGRRTPNMADQTKPLQAAPCPFDALSQVPVAHTQTFPRTAQEQPAAGRGI